MDMRLWVLGGLFFIACAFVILSRYLSEFRKYTTLNWPSIIVSLFLVLIGAGVAGLTVYWSFYMENERIFYDQIKVIKRLYHGTVLECSNTISISKKLIAKTNKDTFIEDRFESYISQSLFQNPLAYKHSGNEYIFALNAYLENLKRTNITLDLVTSDFAEDSIISDENLNKLKSNLGRLLYYSNLLQYLSQYYVYLYGDEDVIKPPGQERVLEWIVNPNKENLEKIQKASSELDGQKEEIYKNGRVVWEGMR